MRSSLTIVLLVGLLSAHTGTGFGQSITLKTIPLGLVPRNARVVIEWQEDVQATLYYGGSPGRHPNHLAVSGRKRLQFVPTDVGLDPGVYYCIVSNGFLRSQEFQLIVESDVAPQMLAPANGSVVRELHPEFRWSTVPGVPYYHIIVSDREARLVEDEEGNLRLEGANIVWQAITAATSIRYGEPDPSGSFSGVDRLAPPLTPGATYNWIVLNNYGNHPAYSSIVQAGLFGFTVQLSNAPQTPALVSPADGATLEAREIEFRWQAVTGAHHYLFSVYELLEQQDSRSSYPVYSVTTTSLSHRLNARSVLKAGQYFWQVYAVAEDGAASASERRSFTYDVPSSAVEFRTWSTSRRVLPRVSLTVLATDGSQELSTLLTTDGGSFVLALQAGSYQVRATRDGYADTTVTFLADPGDTIQVDIVLRPLPAQVSGEVRRTDGSVPDRAWVHAVERETGDGKSAEVVDGRFTLRVSPGVWHLWASENGYIAADTAEVNATGRTTELPQPLRLRRLTAILRGSVLTSRGKSVANATVYAFASSERLTAHTDPLGQFQLEVWPGEWVVRAGKDGFGDSDPRVVTAAAGGEVSVDPPLVLRSDALEVNGLVLTGDTGIPAARVLAIPPAGPYYEAETDARGTFHLALPAGEYELFVSRPGYRPPTPVFLHLGAGGEPVALTVRLARTTAVARGTVFSPDGSPAPGCLVAAGAFRDTTDAAGVFELHLPPGTHRLRARGEGHAPSPFLEVTLVEGQTAAGLALRSRDPAAQVRGTVRSNGEGVAAATVRAYQSQDTVETVTDVLGRYSLWLSPGVWTVRVTKSGFESATRTGVALNAGQTLSGIDFLLVERAAYVEGKVHGPSGEAVQNAVVEATGALLYFTASDGRYRLRLSPGSHQLRVQADGYAGAKANVALAAGQIVTKNFTLSRRGIVQGHVTATSGPALWNAVVRAIRGSDTTETRTDHAGEYILSLDAGSYTVEFDQLGYRRVSRAIQVQAGTQLNLDASLPADPSEIASLSGTIRTLRGIAVAGVHLSLRGRERRNLSTDLDGRYRLERLEAGYPFALTPTRRGMFFLPRVRQYSPLQGNLTGQDFLAAYYGDVSGNDKISSFDGSLVLRVSAEQDVSPHYTHQPRDSIAADVSANGSVSSFDASLIFRYAAGLIERFPADVAPEWLPKPTIPGGGSPVARLQPTVSGDTFRLVLQIECASEFYSFDLTLTYPPRKVRFLRAERAEGAANLRIAYSTRPGRLRLAAASTVPLDRARPLVTLVFAMETPATSAVRVSEVLVDELPAETVQSEEPPFEAGVRTRPNPFNSAVRIDYCVPQMPAASARPRLVVFDVLGRVVLRFDDLAAEPGWHSAQWDGSDSAGVPVASGIYLVVFECGNQRAVRKVLCVR